MDNHRQLSACYVKTENGEERVMSRNALPQIIAMGGGGFSMEPDNPLLDRYVLAISRREQPSVCFLPTASGDADGSIKDFYAAFARFPCRPSHLSLFNPPRADLRAVLLAQDVIYVGGGNTRNLLVLWREWGLDRALREAWEAGVVLTGLSAGMICWFEHGVTDSTPGLTGAAVDDLTALPGLGFLSGSSCPHYDSEPARRPVYHRLIADRVIGDGYAAEDGVALHFIEGELARVVSSRPGAQAYRVERHGEAAVETPLSSIYLRDSTLLS